MVKQSGFGDEDAQTSTRIPNSMRSNTRCHALKKKFKVVHKFILYCGALLAISLIIVDIFYLLMTLG